MNTPASSAADAISWIPLSRLHQQFESNLLSLAERDAALAERLAELMPKSEYFLAAQGERVLLARRDNPQDVANVLPNPVTPAQARDVASKVFPQAVYNQPFLIAGLDQGWLWEAIAKLNCSTPLSPGMRLPLYLLACDIERLWVVLHYQKFNALLSDPRVHLLVGPDALDQLHDLLLCNPRLIQPQMSVTVEKRIWSAGRNLDWLTGSLNNHVVARLTALRRDISAVQSRLDLPQLADKLRSGRPLRILGITSRFTTFLQYSMRDWLASLEKMGHQTRLIIERADHEITPPTVYAQECLSFDPDLILIIDHYRAEVPGLPEKTPCVMWIQDRLPHIFNARGGAAQQTTDYVIGHGWKECTRNYGYPVNRFMPAMVGVNEDRFAPHDLTSEETNRYACDVSFVSHASMPAERIIEEEGRRATPQVARLLRDIYERLNAVYEAGQCITEQPELNAILNVAVGDNHIAGDLEPLRTMITQRVNNALLRHQAIRWVAQTGADLRLYGRGWEDHPEFKQFARGIAENQSQLATIYRASRINLQVTPFGSAHQRTFEGLAAGGFFLLRGVSGDAIELVRQQIWNWSRRVGANDIDMVLRRGQRDPEFLRLWQQLTTLVGGDPNSDPNLYDGMEESALAGFNQTAGQLWPEFDRVVFWNQKELAERVAYYLANPDHRQSIAQSMRRRVLETHTYAAISRRMLAFIADDLKAAHTASACPLAAAA